MYIVPGSVWCKDNPVPIIRNNTIIPVFSSILRVSSYRQRLKTNNGIFRDSQKILEKLSKLGFLKGL